MAMDARQEVVCGAVPLMRGANEPDAPPEQLMTGGAEVEKPDPGLETLMTLTFPRIPENNCPCPPAHLMLGREAGE